MKPRLLIVNDDGITSPFLPIFAEAMAEFAQVAIVVPAREQSWIGRAFNRHSEVVVQRRDFFGFECHAVGGTPSDCVNIALAHIYKDSLPDVVVSGLNIGQNIGLPLLWSSGTFAGAVEAAGSGFRSFAFSMRLEKKFYDICRVHHKDVPAEFKPHLQAACAHASNFVKKGLGKPFKDGEIINVNYPSNFSLKSGFKKCVPAKLRLTSLYKKNERGNFDFSYALGARCAQKSLTDLDALNEGYACWSRIVI